MFSTGQPSRQPSIQPSIQPTSNPTASGGNFVGFTKYDCVPGCDPGTILSLPVAAVANGWSSDTGGVNMICSTCHQNWWAIRPVFGDYTGSYVYLQGTGGLAPWDIRLSYTFQGVIPGSSYMVGFWQQNRDALSLATWTVKLDGMVVYNIPPTNSPQYIQSTSVVATSSSLTLVFEGINTAYDWRSVYLNGVTLMQTAPSRQPTGQPTGQPATLLSGRMQQVTSLSLFVSCLRVLYTFDFAVILSVVPRWIVIVSFHLFCCISLFRLLH